MSDRQHPVRNQENEARDAVAQAWALLDEHERKKALPLLRKAVEILEGIKSVRPKWVPKPQQAVDRCA